MNPEQKVLVYVGPNLVKRGLRKYQIYKGGLPIMATELIKAEPLAAQLFVPLEEMQAAIKATSQKGTPVNLAYETLLAKGAK